MGIRILKQIRKSMSGSPCQKGGACQPARHAPNSDVLVLSSTSYTVSMNRRQPCARVRRQQGRCAAPGRLLESCSEGCWRTVSEGCSGASGSFREAAENWSSHVFLIFARMHKYIIIYYIYRL